MGFIMKLYLLGLNTEELGRLAVQEGEPAYRGKQLAEWIYRRHARAFEEMTDLSVSFRSFLTDKYLVGRSKPVIERRSRDGTVKLLLEMVDGARVETVGLPYEDRLSCCVSTQVGCTVGCLFCATGLSGYVRNLTAGEIVAQVLAVEEAMRDGPAQLERIDHVTFMGMGEPLLNYEATLKALSLLNGEKGIAARNLTVSTSGFVPGILKLAREKLQITLAISLHAASDELRRRLVPGMAKWSISEIMGAVRDYFKQSGRRPTFEYCLLDGENDSIEEAHKLAGLLHGLNCHVNLIPYNQVTELGLRASPERQVRVFREVLKRAGIQVTQRQERGADIEAACGQLRRRT
jgi:23S rRNA (adenine2503-C2)-methyltransferase